jgi:RNA polymerase-interacting CarD/CdnL/TRCF family regulator
MSPELLALTIDRARLLRELAKTMRDPGHRTTAQERQLERKAIRAEAGRLRSALHINGEHIIRLNMAAARKAFPTKFTEKT